MESQSTVTITRSRLSAERLALAACTCVVAGVALILLLWLFSQCLDFAVDTLVAGLWTGVGLTYLAAPLLGVLACVQLFRDRRRVASLDDIHVRRMARWLGRAAVLFGMLSLLVLVGCPSVGEVIENHILARVIDLWLAVPGLLGLVLGIASFRLASKHPGSGPVPLGPILATVIGLITILVPLSITVILFLVNSVAYWTRSPAFHGDTGSLGQTVVVPILDAPMPTGKNVIWCSSFQLAWNELRDTVVREPIRLTGEQELADRLNAAGPLQDDLDPPSHLAVTGTVGGGVRERIREQMARKFPGVSVPAYENLPAETLVMWAYLEAEAKFKHPFENDADGMEFTDSAGHKTRVASFGVWKDAAGYDKLREQVRIVYHPMRRTREFAVDLCRYTEPYQIILARIDPKPTLALTLDDLNDKMAQFARNEDRESLQELGRFDKLYVPEMFLEITHRFADLEGKTILNHAVAGSAIGLAEQTIHFRLDRCGAVLRSRTSLFVVLAAGRTFAFDGPFLVCMKKRGSERPFFVMWVDNAELLTRK